VRAKRRVAHPQRRSVMQEDYVGGPGITRKSEIIALDAYPFGLLNFRLINLDQFDHLKDPDRSL
jgi:hypothetical protein